MPFDEPMTNYAQLSRELTALVAQENNSICLLANSCALLFHHLAQINWLGFYLRQDSTLLLGPFQGKIACQRIKLPQGVCGHAVTTGQVVRVDEVEQFVGHIACDSASRSEIVLPLWLNGQVVAVLDIDSPVIGRFSPQDEKSLTALTQIINNQLELTDYLAVISQMSC